MAEMESGSATDSGELKTLSIRVGASTRDQFTTRASAEGVNQTEMFERMMARYGANGSAEDRANEDQDSGTEFDQERAELSHATASILVAAKELEGLAKKIKEAEGAEGYKRSLKEVAEEASAINTLLGGIKRLHEVIGTSHKTIVEAASNASEPFQKIVADQAQQAQNYDKLYREMATNISTLNKATTDAVQKADRIANTLDHSVTNAVVQSAHNVFEKTERYVGYRATFLNVLMVISALGLTTAGASLYYVGFVLRGQQAEIQTSCLDVKNELVDASCQFKLKKNQKPITDLMNRVRCSN